MAKIKLRLKEFELEVEAERDEIPQIISNVGRQVAGMLEPAAGLATSSPPRRLIQAQLIEQTNGAGCNAAGDKGENKRGGRRAAKASGTKAADAVDFIHDSGAWGFPLQDFNTAEKAIYVLYIVEQMKEITELSAGAIAATFNKVYRQAGQVRPSNVSKYLGQARAAKPALVDENATTAPSTWFLTVEGRKVAADLVSKARGLYDTTGAEGAVQGNGAH